MINEQASCKVFLAAWKLSCEQTLGLAACPAPGEGGVGAEFPPGHIVPSGWKGCR